MTVTESPRLNSSSTNLGGAARRDADCNVVWLRGEYDISNETALLLILTRAIELSESDLIVDLSGVQFMGAAAIGVLIGVRNDLRDLSRSLTLRSPSEPARCILGLCGLTDLLAPPSP
jgi:anti-anti-sigma factor